MVIECPTCRMHLRVPDESVGQQVRCAGCGAVLKVPGAAVSQGLGRPGPPAVPQTPAAPPIPTPPPAAYQCPACHAPVQVDDESKGKQLACPLCAAVFSVSLFDTITLIQAADAAGEPTALTPFDFAENRGGQIAGAPAGVTRHDALRHIAAWFFHATACMVIVNVIIRLLASAARNQGNLGSYAVSCLLSTVALISMPIFIAAGLEVRHLTHRYMTITGAAFGFLTALAGLFAFCGFALDPVAGLGDQPGLAVVSVAGMTVQAMLAGVAAVFAVMALKHRL